MSCPFRYKNILTKELLYKLYVLEKKSIPEISDIVNASMSTVRLYIISYDIELRDRTSAINLVKHKISKAMKGKTRIFSDEWKNNMKISKLKWSEVNAKGYSLKPSGYYEVTKGKNKSRPLHVVIYENHIGRKLNKNEVIHHINFIKTDNRIENLQLMSPLEHSSLHAKLAKRDRNKLGQFT